MREIEKYRTSTGREPFSNWLENLPQEIQWRVYAYVRRVAQGGAHNHIESVGDGVKEIRIHFGPGYRVYFGEVRNKIILLLLGGIKRTQSKDIQQARIYWRNYHETSQII